MTYRECYEKGCLALQTAGIEEATLDARLLLEAVCGTNRNDLLVHGEQSVTPEAEEKYLGWIGQRAEHIPLQQLTGEQDFMGLTFAVNEHVLIPRQDTEILVEVTPRFVEIWDEDENRNAFQIFLDFDKKTVEIKPYD